MIISLLFEVDFVVWECEEIILLVCLYSVFKRR